ncbi:J domain-containing protein [Aromatoleum bremense]|uniref:Molecular chaperone DnaJ n=1 Tax=Aromatoleum bremense TaxID=76115 RepID=A0ABX1NTZ6_9RHOO|nr:J domain-containing protein [Aromatoleum bremense]NMG15002.1 molecular chaperone DnaJ [Aromatoleum bremense]
MLPRRPHVDRRDVRRQTSEFYRPSGFQTMLFDSSKPSIVIAGDKGVSGTLTRNQKTFNRLIKQIEQKRQRLAAWEILLPRYQKKYAEELLPIEAELEGLQLQMVRKLDQAYGQKGLTRTERKVLAEFIANLVAPLLEKSDDPELKEIYNRHSGSDYDEDLAAEKQQLKEMFEGMMGVGLDDDIDFNDPESFLRQAHEKMTEQAEKASAEQASRAARRKKTAKQLAREQAQETEEKEISASIRDVYRKLASALHPDREPDLAERERKNLLMQRVNRAYESRNLLQLLELQLELEHIDPADLAQMSEDRLKRFNAILKDQSKELDMEITGIEHAFTLRFQVDPRQRLSPESMLSLLDVQIVRKKQTFRSMEEDLAKFDDIKEIKALLKDLKSMRFDEGMMF